MQDCTLTFFTQLTSSPTQSHKKMINMRLEFQNAVSTVQRWNDEIVDCEAIKDMTCVNKVKHREPRTFADKELFEQHTIAAMASQKER